MNDTRGRTEERRGVVARHSRLLVGLAICAAVSGACKDGTGPDDDDDQNQDQMCASAQVAFCTDPATKIAAQDASSDASTRSTPALENAAARTAIAASLTELNSALAGGNITKTRTALNAARNAVAAARAQAASFGGDEPDLGSIELLLDHVDRVTG